MAVERMVTEETPSRVLVARVLAEAGIEYVFGISGGHTGRIISGLSQYQTRSAWLPCATKRWGQSWPKFTAG
jgi:hypothetical protein